MAFVRAARQNQPVRIALAGTGGSGKTMTALLTARLLAGEGTVGIIDTEQGSSNLYADRIPGGFSVLRLDKGGPAEMVQALADAAENKIDVLVLDSASAE